MKKKTRLFLIRHAVTDLNTNERYQSKTDLPLSKKGILQAQRLKKHLEAFPINAIMTSPSKRAKETSQILLGERKITIKEQTELNEINFGVWEGFTYEDIRHKYPNELSNWNKNPLVSKIPGGDTMGAVVKRVAKVYREIIKEYIGKNIALVGHGGSLNILLCYLFHISPRAMWQFQLAPASLTEILIDQNSNVVMTLCNDTCYLKGIQ
ncbi:MAG: histidine phosphatase family protein [Nitrosotalea sp.]